MSLDVSLYSRKKKKVLCTCCNHTYRKRKLLYEDNITHNLNKMADEAGIYEALWRPETLGAKYANDIIEVVEKGLSDLNARPEHFKKFDAANGYGKYDNFVPFVSEYLEALKKHPKSRIKAE